MPIACGSKNGSFFTTASDEFTAAGDARFCVAGAAFQGLIACGGTHAFLFLIACGGKKISLVAVCGCPWFYEEGSDKL